MAGGVRRDAHWLVKAGKVRLVWYWLAEVWNGRQGGFSHG